VPNNPAGRAIFSSSLIHVFAPSGCAQSFNSCSMLNFYPFDFAGFIHAFRPVAEQKHLAFFVHTDGASGPIWDQARESLTNPEHIYE